MWDDNDKSVPRNWKAGMSKVNGRRKIFKSPEGFVFQTRVKALEFMMNGNYPENLLCLMKNNLSEEGWVHDRSCPIRWKTRKTLGLEGGGDFEYLSPSLEVIPTMQEMLEFMKSKEGFDLKIVKKLEEKITGMSAENSKKNVRIDKSSDSDNTLKQMIEVDEKREEIDLQSEGEILPAGWSQKWIGHATVFVSPDGSIVHTIKQVINAVEIDKIAVAVKPDSKENVKPTNAEKRKFEDIFVMNKKGRLDSLPKVMKQKSEGFSAEQVTVLEEVHARSLYPDEQKIKNISEATSLTEREVKKWFVKRAAEQSRSLLKSKTRNSSQDSPKQDDSSSGIGGPHAPSNLSQQQISTLIDIFKSKPYPSSENFRQIADRLGSEKQLIVNWFRKRRIEKQAEVESDVKNNDVDRQSQPNAPVNVSADKNDIITEDQERFLQAVLARTKTPTHQNAVLISTNEILRRDDYG